MSVPPLPVLYSFRRCPFAMRARLALWVSGTSYVLREVALQDKPAQMLALSSKGTVPVLHLVNGDVIDESLDVMAWALAQNDPLYWLGGQDQGLIKACDTDFKFHLDRYKYASRFEGIDSMAHRVAGEGFMQILEQRLTTQPFLDGRHQTFTDIAIAPFVRQFALADWEWFFATPYPHTQGWLKAFIVSTAFVQVMDKYPPWRPGNDDTIVRPPPT